MKIYSLIYLILCVTWCNSPTPTYQQDEPIPQQQLQPQDEEQLEYSKQVLEQEQKIRNDNEMSYQNIRSYTFVMNEVDQFLIRTSEEEEIKIQLHIYWKEDNVYLTSSYEENEQVNIVVYENKVKPIFQREFYMVTGFKFKAKKGMLYLLQFTDNGDNHKLISMMMSTTVIYNDNIAGKDDMTNATRKIGKISNQLKAFLTITQKNYLLHDRLSQTLLHHTKLYMNYSLFEACMVILLTSLQLFYISKLLRGPSLV